MKITTNRLLVVLLVLMPFANSAIARQNDRAREQQAREQQARDQAAREQKARAEAARKAQEQQLHDRDAAARAKAEEEAKAKRIENARKEAKEKGPAPRDPNARAVADEILKLETIHREHVARIHRLIAVYREEKNDAHVRELEELNAAWMKRYENARNRLRQRAGDAEFDRIDRALDHGRSPGAEHGDEAKRIENARKKEELEKREANARAEGKKKE